MGMTIAEASRSNELSSTEMIFKWLISKLCSEMS